MSEIYLSLCKVQALAGCLDDAITNALTDNPSEAGERALCLVDLLVEHMEAIVRMMEDQDLLTPFRWGMVVVLSLSANRASGGTSFARKTAFRREKSEENFPGRRKRQKPPGRSQTRRAVCTV